MGGQFYSLFYETNCHVSLKSDNQSPAFLAEVRGQRGHAMKRNWPIKRTCLIKCNWGSRSNLNHPSRLFWDSGEIKPESLCNFSIAGCLTNGTFLIGEDLGIADLNSIHKTKEQTALWATVMIFLELTFRRSSSRSISSCISIHGSAISNSFSFSST